MSNSTQQRFKATLGAVFVSVLCVACSESAPTTDAEPTIGAALSGADIPTASATDAPVISVNGPGLGTSTTGDGSQGIPTGSASAESNVLIGGSVPQIGSIPQFNESDTNTDTATPTDTTTPEPEPVPAENSAEPDTGQPEVVTSNEDNSVTDASNSGAESNGSPDPGAAQPETIVSESDNNDSDSASRQPVAAASLEVSTSDTNGPASSAIDDPLSAGLSTGRYLGDRSCLDLPNQDIAFGDVNSSDWRSWLPNYTYEARSQYLMVAGDGDRRYLRQRLEPTSIGSHHVQAGANLNSARSYRLTQSIYFEPDFDWGGSNEGGKLGFGLGGGSNPTGGVVRTDGFSLRFMWRGNRDGTARIVAYSYAADRSQHLPYGDDYPLESFEAPIGEWFELTLEVIVNSSVDASDGVLRAWVDGELRLERENIAWQTSGGTPAVQKFIFATFYGGNDSSWAPSHDTFIRFADVCWAPVVDPATIAFGDPSGESQQPDLIFSDAILQTSRIRLSNVLQELELTMPIVQADANRHLGTALDRINTALTPSQWLDNDTLRDDATSIAKLREAAEELQAVAAVPGVAEYVATEARNKSGLLAAEAIGLVDQSLVRAEARAQAIGCGSDQSGCPMVQAAFAEVRVLLDSATANLVNPVTSFYRSEAAWAELQTALETL